MARVDADTGHARDYCAVALSYARKAVADRRGRIHCKWVRLAAQRHLDDLKRRDWPYRFDPWHGNDVCDFIEKLPHVEGSWDTPTIQLEPSQVFILVVVFGWRRKADGLRRFTRAYIEEARKNAKSTLTAGVALYCLACEGEIGPQVLIGATTGDQARKVFDPAKKMVERTAEFREQFGVEAWAHSITCAESGGYMKPINAKSSTQDGHNPHLAILDELHAHTTRGLFDVLRSAFGARKNPLLWSITTAGYDPEGVCYEQRTLVTKILQGLVEADHYFGIIFTLDIQEPDSDKPGDAPLDEKTWIKANPLLGVAVHLDELRGFAIEARNSPDSMHEFMTKRLNIWTTAKGAWVNVEKWKRCNGPVDLEALEGVPCWAGLDLASVSDLCAFMLAWRVDGRLHCWGRYWLPEDVVLPRTERNNVPYKRWRDQGLLVTTPGNVTDYAWIEKDVKATLSRFQVQTLAFDPWNAQDLCNRLMEAQAPMVEYRQGFKSFNPAMKEIQRAYTGGMLAHGGDPVLAWAASNVVVRRDENDNIAPDKKHSHEKIDPFVALAMAVGMLIRQEDNSSVYETRGVLTLGEV